MQWYNAIIESPDCNLYLDCDTPVDKTVSARAHLYPFNLNIILHVETSFSNIKKYITDAVLKKK